MEEKENKILIQELWYLLKAAKNGSGIDWKI